MKRLLGQFLTAISLLIFLAAVGFGVRSIWTCDALVRSHIEFPLTGPGGVFSVSDRHQILVARGGLLLEHVRTEATFLSEYDIVNAFNWYTDWPNEYPYYRFYGSPPGPTPRFHFIGFECFNETIGDPAYKVRIQSVTIPLPVIALLAAWLPWRFARRWWKRRSLKPGHCAKCGYDLRASPGRCPECGTEITVPAVT